jgi:hypothetical protein
VAALCAYAVALAPAEVRPLLVLPAAATVLLVVAAAVLRRPVLLPWGLALCLGLYAAGLLARGEALDLLAPVYAGVLLLAAELAYWSVETSVASETGGRLLGRAATAAGLALGTAALGSVLLAAAQVRPAGGPLVLAAGVAAAVGAFVLLARFAHGPPR